MVAILILLVVVLIIAGVLYYGIDTFITDPKANQLAKFALLVIIAILVIDTLTTRHFSSGWIR